MMNFLKLLPVAVAIFASALFCIPATASDAKPQQAQRKPISLQTSPKMRNETKWLVYCMERGHYLKMPITDLDVREFIREYMQNIDFFKLFFTAEDVQHFQDFFSPSIDVMLHQGTLLPAFSIYDKFLDRADARLEWIRERMKKPFDFSKEETFRPDRSKEEWPKNWEAANALWEKRLKYDIVNEILSYSVKKNDDEKKKEPADKAGQDKSAEKSAAAPKQTEKEKFAEVVEEEVEAPKTFEEKLAKAEKEVLRRYERLIERRTQWRFRKYTLIRSRTSTTRTHLSFPNTISKNLTSQFAMRLSESARCFKTRTDIAQYPSLCQAALPKNANC